MKTTVSYQKNMLMIPLTFVNEQFIFWNSLLSTTSLNYSELTWTMLTAVNSVSIVLANQVSSCIVLANQVILCIVLANQVILCIVLANQVILCIVLANQVTFCIVLANRVSFWSQTPSKRVH